MSSSKLKVDVEKALDRYYPGVHFAVTVKDPGIVTIKGTSSTYWDKLNTFSIISRVKGVIDISDQINVETEKVADNIIKSNIMNELKLNKAIIDPSRIDVAVNNGEVILRGTVPFYRGAVMAEDISSWQNGVKGVISEIKVFSKDKLMVDEDLSIVLKDMINEYFPLEKNTVQIKVEKGQVTLSGTVNTLWAKRNIEKEMLHVSGVNSVQNNLKIVQKS